MAYYISQGRVETPTRKGGQLCCTSVVNLFAKNYQNRPTMRFDKVIAKIKGCDFSPHSVYVATNLIQHRYSVRKPIKLNFNIFIGL